MTEFEYEFSDRASPWLDASGPMSDIVISSRVRLARNLAGFPFLSMSSDAERRQVVEMCATHFRDLTDHEPTWWFDMSDASPTDREIFLERRLISRQHAISTHPRALAISPDESVAVMINEEDHLRVQSMRSGLDLTAALDRANQLDNLLEERVQYAYRPQLGYLTACPTNVGTGIRVSAMLHLPGLGLTGEIEKAKRAAKDMHLAVRGCHGEGSHAIGDLYQISNQTTLGRSEKEIMEDFTYEVVPALIAYEHAAREALMNEKQHVVEDRVFRSLATLREARLLGEDEVIALLCDLRLGIGVGLVEEITFAEINELMVLTQSAHLQRLADQFLNDEEQARFRANLTRVKLGHNEV